MEAVPLLREGSRTRYLTDTTDRDAADAARQPRHDLSSDSSDSNDDDDDHLHDDYNGSTSKAKRRHNPKNMGGRARTAAQRASKSLSRFFGLDEEEFPLQSDRAVVPAQPRSGAIEGGGGGGGGRNQGSQPLVRPDKDTLYFHGAMAADAAVHRLQIQGGEDGLFLVREDSVGNYVLCLCAEDRVQQFLITAGSVVKGKYCIEGGPPFSSLDSFVTFYAAERDGLPVVLTRPCPKTNMVSALSLRGAPAAGSVADWLRPANAKGAAAVTPTDDEGSPLAESTSAGRALARTASTTSTTSSNSVAAAKRRTRQRAYEPFDPSKAPKAKEQFELVGSNQFRPHFINLVSALQVLIMLYLILKGGMDDFNITPVVRTETVEVGFELKQVTISVARMGNPFVGPTTRYLVAQGAKFSPCMRKDIAVFAELARVKEQELRLGCCQDTPGNASFSTCGMTSEDECPARWLGAGVRCADTCDDFRLRPCCTQLNGTCEVTTESYCTAVQGVWQAQAQLCSDVSCLQVGCHKKFRDPEEPNQGWRLIASLFLHSGAVHLLLNLIVQMSIGSGVERKVGWFRTALMYFISGIGGNLTSSVFAPKLPQVGAAGAIYGMVGVALVDLFHCWPVMKTPWQTLNKFLVQVVALLLVGTTPWLDNFAHVGGFLFGILSGIVFLPYVTFSTWDKLRKR
jgi:membrane associated rhomboid family serine protease